MKTIGANIKAYREAQGLTLRQLEALSGIHFGQLGRYERNERIPGTLNLIALADTLGVTLDDLVGRNFKEARMKEFYLKETHKSGLYTLHVNGTKVLHVNGTDLWTMQEVLDWLEAKHKADSREISDR